jgi:hypothetical protein
MQGAADTQNAAVEGEKLVPDDFDWQAAEQAAAADFAAAHVDRSTLRLDDGGSDVAELLHFDEAADTIAIERVQDVEATLEWCKGRYNEGLANRHCEFRHIASIPTNALQIWGEKTYGAGSLPAEWWLKKEYHHLVIRATHDSDLSGFRTLSGNYARRGE